MKKESIIEIWDWLDTILIFSASLLAINDVLTETTHKISFISGLLVLGIIGFIIKFHYNIRWISVVMIESIINIIFGIFMTYYYFIR